VPPDSPRPEPSAREARVDGDPRYRAILDRMLRAQAHRERGAERLFQGALPLAPDDQARRRVRAHVDEERRHYAQVAGVWSAAFQRPTSALDSWVETRLRERPLPPVGSWLELAMAQFLFDRAGCWQLGEYVESSFAPYRALAREIVEDERGHQDAGARQVIALCNDAGAARGTAQDAFTRWLGVALLSFGRPGGDGNRFAVAAGLKRRDSALVMRDFLDDVRPTARAARLVFPPPGVLAVSLPEGLDGSW
jgi:1,2-phenylacetyl-CoA epoxidase catalytic subunit